MSNTNKLFKKIYYLFLSMLFILVGCNRVGSEIKSRNYSNPNPSIQNYNRNSNNIVTDNNQAQNTRSYSSSKPIVNTDITYPKTNTNIIYSDIGTNTNTTYPNTNINITRPDDQPKNNVPVNKQAKNNVNTKENKNNNAASKPKATKDNADNKDKKNNNIALSSFTTKFNAGNIPRASNIKRAADKLNGTIVGSGEVFSFNNTIGPTGKSNGYSEAKIIVKGKESKGYGGGVCQVSSTLFNACDQAGLKILERNSHSKAVSYVGKDRDAATSYGGVDFKFKNTKNNPIKINASVSGGSISVSLSEQSTT